MTNLFSPYSLGNMTLANRVVMAPMTRSMSPGNIPDDNVVEYYRQRAEGGVGLIITEGTCVGHKAASGYPNVPFMAGQEPLAGWKKVIDAVHAAGGKIAPQLWHVGGIRKPGIMPGGDEPGHSPSGMAFPGKVTGHAMTQTDIDEATAAFVQAAVDSERIGFDAIELHGAHGYLLDQFFWQGTNVREDQYGGNLENRVRFAVDIVKGIRAEVSADYPIIFRFSQWKQQDYGARLAETPEALAEFLQHLVDAGVDIFHCSQRRFWESEFEGSELNLAGWTKKLTGKPAITVGSVSLNADFLPEAGDAGFKDGEISSLDNLVERLDADEFDLVAVGRALIANPDWSNKVKADQLSSLTAFNKSMLMTLV
ncbi:MAG: 2,4-dienoyl-CoA reductase-like NADH-dependent reductase (Old Yellow Enzyme family) [Arenicella sp.]|jgi:2,4-dienoyl-CoA reductase-like NADH-dependent reductase (Old Yellow Enzyme family)